MKIRHFLLLVVIVMSSWAVGCAPVEDTLDYLTVGGRAEVAGEMSGVAFSAVVEIAKDGECVRVEYLSPESLKGMVFVTEGETCEVFLGDVSFVCDPCEVAGFLRPATAFLQHGDANSVQKEGENRVLTFPTGETLTLSSSGTPISLNRDDIYLRVIWWEKI